MHFNRQRANKLFKKRARLKKKINLIFSFLFYKKEMSKTPSTASVGAQKQSNSPGFDAKPPNNRNQLIQGPFSVEDDEYSDPDILYSEEDAEEDQFDEDQTLFIPDIDQRKICQPIYCPLIAEKIILNSQAMEQDLGLSTEIFRQVQPHLSPSQHEIALIWIVRAYSLFKFREDESLFKSIYLLDMLLCRMPIAFNDLQLMSIVCIWISCKVESNLHIPISSLCMICSNQLTDAQIKAAEPVIVTELNCNLNPPTPLFYIPRFLEAIDADENLSNVAYFFIDVSLVYHEFLDYSPTVIAVSSVCGSKLCMNEFCPTPRLFGYAHVNDKEKIRQCICLLFTHANAIIHQNKSAIKDRFKGDVSLLYEINLDTSIVSQL